MVHQSHIEVHNFHLEFNEKLSLNLTYKLIKN